MVECIASISGKKRGWDHRSAGLRMCGIELERAAEVHTVPTSGAIGSADRNALESSSCWRDVIVNMPSRVKVVGPEGYVI